MPERKIVVIGAGGPLGLETVRLLSKVDATIIAAYRTEWPGLIDKLRSFGAQPVPLDLKDKAKVDSLLNGATHVVFAPILTAAKNILHALPENAKSIFFSSYNVDVDMEAPVYASLRKAEADLLAAVPDAIILRPTMVYGHGRDRNLSRLMSAMRRWPFVVMPGNGKARQQPLFYRDLAAIVAQTLLGTQITNGIHTVAGPVPVTQREVFEAAKRASGKRTLIVPAPLTPVIWAVKGVQRLGRSVPMTPAQLSRANQDKVSSQPASLLGSTPLGEGLVHLAKALDAEQPGT